MRALLDLQHGVDKVSLEVQRYGAKKAADRLRAASGLINRQPFDPLHLDIVLRLLDPSMLRQEIEVATRQKAERWYFARRILNLLLLICTIFVLSLVALIYLGGSAGGRLTLLSPPLGLCVLDEYNGPSSVLIKPVPDFPSNYKILQKDFCWTQPGTIQSSLAIPPI